MLLSRSSLSSDPTLQVSLNIIVFFFLLPVQSLLALDHCVGIIGGKPKHSVYFVGFQDEKLLHLDPHYCQSASEVYDSQQLDDSLIRVCLQIYGLNLA